MIELTRAQVMTADADAGEPGSPGGAGKPGQAGGAGGQGGAGGKPGGHGGAGGAGGRGGDAEDAGSAGNGAGLEDLRHIAEQSKQRGHLVNYVTAGILLFLTGWAVLNWWQGQQAIRIESIKIDNVQVLSASALCPGETLVIGFDLKIEGLGKILFDDSVFHAQHPVQFSRTDSLIVASSRIVRTENEWTIPLQPARAIEGRREWVEGQYTRLISVAPSNSYVSRFTPPAILEAPFSIRSDCP